MLQRNKAATSNLTSLSLTSPTSPTLENPTRGFGIQRDTEPASTNQHSSQPSIGHDITRISMRPQAKLTVSEPGESEEQEADSEVQTAMRMVAPNTSSSFVPIKDNYTIQRTASKDKGKKAAESSSKTPDNSSTKKTGEISSKTSTNSLAVKTSERQEKRNKFESKHKDFAFLLQGFNDKMKDQEIVQLLLNNFKQRKDFKYTGTSKGGWVHEGDCSTLVRQFVNIANECFGINMEVSSREKGPFFIQGGGKIIHNEDKTGNVDKGTHWRFDDHVWAIWKGKEIDVLFGQIGLKQSVKVDEDKDNTFTVNGTTYYVANDETRTEINAYTSSEKDRFRFDLIASRPKVKNSFCTIM